MRGRTMYVVPYIMGPANSPISKIGVEVTDSPYVVANMRIMCRMGKVAQDKLGSSKDFVPGLHSVGDLDPMRRLIAHFPEERLIWSVGSAVRRKRAPGKEMFCAADCQLHGAATRLDGRAHADSGARISGRESDVHGRGVSERLRKDEPGDDGVRAGEPGI